MIVKMKHLDLVCIAAEADATLSVLRDLGAVHLDLESAKGAEVAAAKGAAAKAEQAVRTILKARETLSYAETLTRQPCTAEDVLKMSAARDEAVAAREALDKDIRKYEPYGDFDPALAKSLLDRLGEDLTNVVTLPDVLPAERLSQMRARAEELDAQILAETSHLAACDETCITAAYPAIADRIAFSAAKQLMAREGLVSFVSGWIPVTCVGKLRDAAAKQGWGILLRDPAEGEVPPTLVEPPKFFKPVKALFDGLGVAPAYTESDVSVPFMCYFSLFFAMLVGDGAYGAIFLLATLAMRKKLSKNWFCLLTTFSIATVIWGAISGTWFGANILVKEIDGVLVPRFDSLTSVSGPAMWLADIKYHNMMLLCFTIGASHLVLARLWNAVCKAPDSTALAELGWAGVLVMMYLVTNSIVGIFSGIPAWGFWLGGISVVLVFGFSVKPSELKSRGAELGMLPLNIMSALGDIISYVRLFAVGLASVKVAENFNAMATGLNLPLWLKIVPMVAILVVGHGLNLAMAGLSILVHAVRLNTLEFSNHKGVSWAGYAFRPFRKA